MSLSYCFIMYDYKYCRFLFKKRRIDAQREGGKKSLYTGKIKF